MFKTTTYDNNSLYARLLQYIYNKLRTTCYFFIFHAFSLVMQRMTKYEFSKTTVDCFKFVQTFEALDILFVYETKYKCNTQEVHFFIPALFPCSGKLFTTVNIIFDKSVMSMTMARIQFALRYLVR